MYGSGSGIVYRYQRRPNAMRAVLMQMDAGSIALEDNPVCRV
jgi:hypothetical protein